MDAQIQLLLETLDCGFNKTSWHGPNLVNSVRGVNARIAARSVHGRKSIWQQVLHAAYWKQRVLNKLVGTQPFPRSGSNWLKLPPKITKAAWKRDVELLHEIHGKLRRSAAALKSSQLTPKLRMMIIGVAAHDVYHAGQIRLLRKLLARR